MITKNCLPLTDEITVNLVLKYLQHLHQPAIVYQPEIANFQSKKCCNFVKMIFSLKKRGTDLQYSCNIYAKFQIDCLKSVGGVDYTNLFKHDGQTDRRAGVKQKPFCLSSRGHNDGFLMHKKFGWLVVLGLTAL